MIGEVIIVHDAMYIQPRSFVPGADSPSYRDSDTDDRDYHAIGPALERDWPDCEDVWAPVP